MTPCTIKHFPCVMYHLELLMSKTPPLEEIGCGWAVTEDIHLENLIPFYPPGLFLPVRLYNEESLKLYLHPEIFGH